MLGKKKMRKALTLLSNVSFFLIALLIALPFLITLLYFNSLPTQQKKDLMCEVTVRLNSFFATNFNPPLFPPIAEKDCEKMETIDVCKDFQSGKACAYLQLSLQKPFLLEKNLTTFDYLQSIFGKCRNEITKETLPWAKLYVALKFDDFLKRCWVLFGQGKLNPERGDHVDYYSCGTFYFLAPKEVTVTEGDIIIASFLREGLTDPPDFLESYNPKQDFSINWQSYFQVSKEFYTSLTQKYKSYDGKESLELTANIYKILLNGLPTAENNRVFYVYLFPPNIEENKVTYALKPYTPIAVYFVDNKETKGAYGTVAAWITILNILALAISFIALAILIVLSGPIGLIVLSLIGLIVSSLSLITNKVVTTTLSQWLSNLVNFFIPGYIPFYSNVLKWWQDYAHNNIKKDLLLVISPGIGNIDFKSLIFPKGEDEREAADLIRILNGISFAKLYFYLCGDCKSNFESVYDHYSKNLITIDMQGGYIKKVTLELPPTRNPSIKVANYHFFYCIAMLNEAKAKNLCSQAVSKYTCFVQGIGVPYNSFQVPQVKGSGIEYIYFGLIRKDLVPMCKMNERCDEVSSFLARGLLVNDPSVFVFELTNPPIGGLSSEKANKDVVVATLETLCNK